MKRRAPDRPPQSIKTKTEALIRDICDAPSRAITRLADQHKRLREYIDRGEFGTDPVAIAYSRGVARAEAMREGKKARGARRRSDFRAAVKAAHEVGEAAAKAFPEAERITPAMIIYLKAAGHGIESLDARPIVKELSVRPERS